MNCLRRGWAGWVKNPPKIVYVEFESSLIERSFKTVRGQIWRSVEIEWLDSLDVLIYFI